MDLAALGVEVVVSAGLFHACGRAFGDGSCRAAVGVDQGVLIDSGFSDLFNHKACVGFFDLVNAVGVFDDFPVVGARVRLHLGELTACLVVVFIVNNERITDCII